MRHYIASIVVLVASFMASFAAAQDYHHRGSHACRPYVHHHHSTYHSGVLHGRADYVRGLGAYNYNTSLALINLQEARSRALDNEIKKTQTYFEKRRLNREYRTAERPRKTAADIARYMAKPPVAPLTDAEVCRQTNTLHWPVILQATVFTNERAEIDAIFASRSVADSGKGSFSELELHEAIRVLKAKVGEYARDLGAKHYITAKRFIRSLELEASTPLGIQGLAITP